MATAETQVRVSESEAAWLNSLRDRYGFASVAVVMARLRQTLGDEFERQQDAALRAAEEGRVAARRGTS